jgi:hypothetical protein
VLQIPVASRCPCISVGCRQQRVELRLRRCRLPKFGCMVHNFAEACGQIFTRPFDPHVRVVLPARADGFGKRRGQSATISSDHSNSLASMRASQAVEPILTGPAAFFNSIWRTVSLPTSSRRMMALSGGYHNHPSTRNARSTWAVAVSTNVSSFSGLRGSQAAKSQCGRP